jgi:dsDNA-specific endonuclease/ATPase MutS2
MMNDDAIVLGKSATCFEYIDPATVTPLQNAVHNAGVQKRNELSAKRDEICAELQQEYILRCPR